jgi:hypothetical protein
MHADIQIVSKPFVQSQTGLPDGLFSNQKSKFGQILEGFAMEYDGIFDKHLDHFTAFCWYILWTFSISRGNLIFFWSFVPRKIWQP